MEYKTINKDTIVYRSYSDDSNREGYWFALNKSDVLGYGNKTGGYKVLKNLKLINITHDNFYTILKSSLKVTIQLDPLLYKNAHSILFPLGFDDTTFYRDLAATAGIEPMSYSLAPDVHIASILFFNGRSRLSINQCDTELMKYLQIVFGSTYDGIISDKNFPDIIRNGFHFPEISIFDKSSIEFVGEVARPVFGGAENAKFLLPIDSKTLTPEFQESIRRTSEIINGLDVEKIRSQMPTYEAHEAPLSTPTTKYESTPSIRKTRKLRRANRHSITHPNSIGK